MIAQRPGILTRPGIPNVPGMGGGGNTGGSDSLARRIEDTISIRFYYLDSTRAYTLDSSVNDYTRRFPIPATHVFLGNTGTASRSLLFTPRMQAGLDPGFHALDVYKWNLEKVRFFNTTKPYTELGFTLASRVEQIIEIFHTQNIKTYWNASFNYRLINSPGSFRNQRTNHNNYLFTSWYQAPGKRYNNYFVILSNNLQAGENGGIESRRFLDDPVYSRDRFTIPTKIGGQPSFGAEFFNRNLYTGRNDKEVTYYLRQQYDLGRKDSLVTDSTVIPLFYPRLRLEHSLKYMNSSYLYQDVPVSGKQTNTPDSIYYATFYNLPLPANDSLIIQDKWLQISNDFSFYQFPDVNNQQQFIKLGAEFQLHRGELKTSTRNFYNFIGHGEYRNRTKSGKWDMLASGRLFLAGFNLGDYQAYVTLQRLLGKNAGSLQVGFENVNRSPSFIYNQQSSFYLDAPKDFNKENTVHFFGSLYEPRFRVQLGADYYAITNYMYIDRFFRLNQEKSIFNVLRVKGSRTFNLSRSWKWHTDVHLQQKAGAVDLNLPLFFTRNRIALEGVFFRNLNLSTGVEVRYHSPYKADNYSPVLGQFYFQDSITINNRPDIAAFFNFRIKSFTAFVRAENLNTLNPGASGIRFNKNNFAAPDYPTAGLIIRLAIYWSFVN